jgi:AraC-like DNA-binding protein
MYHWAVRFDTLEPMQSLPRLWVVASETQFDASYRFEGRNRPQDRYGLFKYTLEGEGVFRDASGEHRLPAGSGFLTRVSDPATAYFYPPDAREPWTFVWTVFDGPTADLLLDELVGRYGHVHRLPRESAAIGQLMAFGGLGEANGDVTPAGGAQVVLTLLLELARARQEARRALPVNVLVRRAQGLVREHLTERLDATRLAGLLGVSREHLSRVFREQTGVSPYQYIVRQRLLEAGRLLRGTNLTGKEIAARLGYATPGHFARSFRATLGVTPGRFRDSGMMPPVL